MTEKKRFFSGIVNVWRLMARHTSETKEGQWLNVPRATSDKQEEKKDIAQKQLKRLLLD
ncbi:MAG TPA: hypothetical protein P5287_04335 [bacterium]|nr:hypothetical protein [bacterium]